MKSGPPPTDLRSETTNLEPNHRLTLTVTEAAGVLGISRASAYECVKTGELPSVRLGGRILIPTKLLNKLLDGDNGQAA